MSVHIINRSGRLTYIPLNSGESIHLAPGERSGPIEELDLEENPKVQKLLKAHLIAETEAAKKGGPSKHGKKK